MHNDILNGVLHGVFGSAVARLLSRFRYITIFCTAVSALYIVSMVALVKDKGFSVGSRIFLSRLFTPTGILAPLGFGMLVVLCVFVASIGARHKKD